MLSVGLVDNLELLLGEFIGLAIRNKIGIKCFSGTKKRPHTFHGRFKQYLKETLL